MPRKAASLVTTLGMLLASLVCVVIVVPSPAGAATVYVGGTGPDNLTTIQAGIDAASPGDTVYVYNGTYTGNPQVNKALSLVGQGRDSTLIRGEIWVTADDVNVSGFTIEARPGITIEGVRSDNTNRLSVTDSRILNVTYGLYLPRGIPGLSTTFTFSRNIVKRAQYGVYLVRATEIVISDNSFETTTASVYLLYSQNATITRNTAVSWDGPTTGPPDETYLGVHLSDTDNTSINDNTIVGAKNGAIFFDRSLSSTLRRNVMTGGGIRIEGQGWGGWNEDVDTSNTVNGRPVYFWRNVTGGSVPLGAGQVILANATGTTVRDQDLRNASVGITVGISSNVRILNNTAAGNVGGIYIASSNGSVVSGNVVTNNTVGVFLGGSDRGVVDNTTAEDNAIGLYVSSSNENLLRDNAIRRYDTGIQLDGAARNTIADNAISGGTRGIDLDFSSNWNLLDRNQISENTQWGIGLHAQIFETTLGNVFTRNTMVGDGIALFGSNVLSSLNSHTIDASNTVNGRPVYYWKNVTGGIVPAGAGEVILVNVSGVTVAGQNLSDGSIGVEVAYSSDCIVQANDGSSNDYLGVYLYETTRTIIANNTVRAGGDMGVALANSDFNLITNNTAWSNPGEGILMSGSSRGNRIYHNNFIENGVQARSGWTNTWDDGYPSGGNYWSDYAGEDRFQGSAQTFPGSDGIGDTPYPIPGGTDQDRYPLVRPLGIVVPPGMPKNLLAVDGDGQVGISWSAPTSDGGAAITSYVVYRGPAPGSETRLLTLGPVTSFLDTGLANGQTYYYRVSAANPAGEGARSTEVSATPATTPTAPVNLAATPGNLRVSLTWQPPTGDGGAPVTGYRVYRGTSPGGEAFYRSTGGLTLNDTAVTNGATYYYQVSASNRKGEGPMSAEVSASPTEPPSAPTAPRNLAAISGPSRVDLSWDTPSSNGTLPILGYRVYRGLASGSLSFLVATGPALIYGDVNVTAGVAHYYAVRAFNAVGEGPPSAEVSATPEADLTPPTVSITRPANGARLTETTVQVEGTAGDNAGVSRVEVSTDGATWVLATGRGTWSAAVTLVLGANRIYAKATDNAGNANTTSVDVFVESAPPGGGLSTTTIALLVLAAALTVVAAVAVWFGIRRRRRTSP